MTRTQTVGTQRAAFLPGWTGSLGARGLGMGLVYAGPGERITRRTTGALRALKAMGRP